MIDTRSLLLQLVCRLAQLVQSVIDSHHGSLKSLGSLRERAVVILFRGLPAGALAAASDGLTVLRATARHVRAAVRRPRGTHVSRGDALQAGRLRRTGALPTPLLRRVLLAQHLERGFLRARLSDG